MEITLEAIELVKDRTGASYKEAKEALEASGGNVVDAIIAIEEKIDGASGTRTGKADRIVEKIKEAVKKGNVTKLTISKNDEVIINLPLNVGIVGTVLFPWAGVAAAVAAVGTKCDITLTKDNGDVINISEKVDNGFDTAFSKGGVIVDEVVDKGSDIFNCAVNKTEDIINYAKDKFRRNDGSPSPEKTVEVEYEEIRHSEDNR